MLLYHHCTTHEALLLQERKVACPICLSGFNRGQAVLCLPCGGRDEHQREAAKPAVAASSTAATSATSSSPCLGHVGHVECLRRAFERSDACPLCRTALPKAGGEEDGAACAEALQRARRNVQRLRGEAAVLRSMSRAEASATRTAKRAAGGAARRGAKGASIRM